MVATLIQPTKTPIETPFLEVHTIYIYMYVCMYVCTDMLWFQASDKPMCGWFNDMTQYKKTHSIGIIPLPSSHGWEDKIIQTIFFAWKQVLRGLLRNKTNPMHYDVYLRQRVV